MIYLDKKQLNLGKSIEPLHKMMEAATRHNNIDRITVDECLKYLDQQIAIAEHGIPDRILSSFIYDESISEVKYQIASDATLLNKPEKILLALSKMVNAVEIVGEEFGETVPFGVLYRVESSGADMFTLSLRINYPFNGRKNRKLYVRIMEMRINDDNLSEIRLEQCSSFTDAGEQHYNTHQRF